MGCCSSSSSSSFPVVSGGRNILSSSDGSDMVSGSCYVSVEGGSGRDIASILPAPAPFTALAVLTLL